MAGIPHSTGDQEARKKAILDYMCDHIGEAHTAEELEEATGIPIDEVKVAAEALAYEHELAKERDEGGHATYRRRQ